MDIIECLERDHEVLKVKTRRLVSDELSLEEKQALFDEITEWLESHAEASEDVVLSYVLQESELRPQGLESLEHHAVTEVLVQRIENTNDPEYWMAKVRVFAKALEQHLESEVKTLIPELRKRLDPEAREMMAQRYTRIREHSNALSGV